MYARNVLVAVGFLTLLAGCAFFRKPPVVNITSVQISPAVFSFHFVGFDPDGIITRIEWDFGDGENGTGQSVEHTYQETARYTVTVTATDNDGNHASTSICVEASREIHVPRDCRTIQAAIDGADEGDTVMVSAGTYTERISFHGKTITVRSLDPLSVGCVGATIIKQRNAEQPDSIGAVVTFNHGETRDSVLSGFTLQGQGYGTDYSGGAVLIVKASPTISYCTIRRFAATLGGGVAMYESCALIERCEISYCNARLNGGGAYIEGTGAFPELHYNTIRNCRAEIGGGVYLRAAIDCKVSDDVIFPVVSGNEILDNGARGNVRAGMNVVGGGIHVGAGVELVVTVPNHYAGNFPYDLGHDYSSPPSSP